MADKKEQALQALMAKKQQCEKEKKKQPAPEAGPLVPELKLMCDIPAVPLVPLACDVPLAVEVDPGVPAEAAVHQVMCDMPEEIEPDRLKLMCDVPEAVPLDGGVGADIDIEALAQAQEAQLMCDIEAVPLAQQTELPMMCDMKVEPLVEESLSEQEEELSEETYHEDLVASGARALPCSSPCSSSLLLSLCFFFHSCVVVVLFVVLVRGVVVVVPPPPHFYLIFSRLSQCLHRWLRVRHFMLVCTYG